MGPGPSAVDPRVLSAMGGSVLDHLDPVFLSMMDRTRSMLRQVFRTANDATLAIAGTGTAAMEAAIANVVEPGDQVVVGVAGYFGGRMADIARRCGGNVTVVETEWGRPVEPDTLKSALDRIVGPVKAVCIVHAETSTGVLQPLDVIVRLAHARDALAVVDAVTSLGGVPVDVDGAAGGEGIDVCYSGAQKCLGASPGLSPLTAGNRAMEVIRKRKHPPFSFNLDLLLLEKYWGKERAYHHTSPCSLFYGLNEALTLLLEEGLEKRLERHRRVHERLLLGTEGLGLEFVVDAEHRLPVLNALRVPDGVDEGDVRRRLLSEHNIEIGAGLGPWKGKVWRVGLMGYSAREENVARFLTAMRIILGAGRMSRPRKA